MESLTGSFRCSRRSAAAAALSVALGLSVISGQTRAPLVRNEAYLFSHMMKYDYGGLYYSLSLDGLHWQLLHGGKRVFDEYHGHSSIAQGADGRYYLVGNRGDDAREIQFLGVGRPDPLEEI